MGFLVGVLVFVVGLLVSIALHEVGHMVPAKRFGVRVSQYMVGFGPTLWSRTRGETEYGIKGIPLGGYVRLIGMYPPGDVVGAKQPKGRIAELVADARDASASEIRPGEDHRAFYRLSTPKKLVVMLGGPVMNLLIAVVLLAVVLMGFGVLTPTTQVAALSQCVLAADAPADAECGPADPVAPALAAGFEPGDVVVAFDGAEISTWGALTERIRESGGRAVVATVERDGQRLDLTVTPLLTERPVLDASGAAVLDATGAPQTVRAGFLGVTPTSAMTPQPASAVPSRVWDMVSQTVGVVVTLPARVVDIVTTTVNGTPRDATSVVGLVGVGRFAGEIAATDVEGYGLKERTADMLGMLAALNLALFAFNLIPLVPLDGGHVAGALWEGGRRQIARLRGAREPRPADTARLMPLAYTVFVLLAGLGLVLVYADLVNPVRLGG